MAKIEKKEAEKDPDLVSVHQLATALDCSTRSVEKYAEQGLVLKVGRGRYKYLESIQNVVRYLRKQASTQASGDGKFDLVEESALFKQAQRKMLEMRVEQMEGRLISVAEVEDAWATLVTETRQMVLSLPGRCRMELPDLTGHEQKLIEGICRDLLTEMALGTGKMPRNSGDKAKANGR